MKKVLLTLLAITATTILNAQTFNITPNGFVSRTDSTKNYYILDSIKADKDYLYKTSLKYFNGLFASPKEVISVVENESITLNFIDRYKIVMGSPWNVNMTYNFKFKDGKIRIEAPYLNKAYRSDFSTITINANSTGQNYPIYKRNGSKELRGKDGLRMKQIIEDNTNLFLLKYITKVTSKNNENDW